MNNYENSQSLTWTIRTDCPNVHVTSSYFDTEKNYDTLTFDGILGYSGPPDAIGYRGSFSGNITIDEELEVIDEWFTVTFQSDSSLGKEGFMLHWSASSECSRPETSIVPGYCAGHHRDDTTVVNQEIVQMSCEDERSSTGNYNHVN